MKVVERPIPEIAEPLGSPPLLERIYRARGVRHPDQLDHSLKRLLPISSLKGVEQAATLVVAAIEQRASIVVVGDYDADGATATAVMVRGLRAMGGEVHYQVPDRKQDGYGLSPQVVEKTLRFRPELLITVDNGIASTAGVVAAQAQGMKVVVTDHHLPGESLPPAEVIVNPNQPEDTFGSHALAGVGVAFYLVCAVRQQLQHRFNPVVLLDLVALGTVADVVPLDHNNRVLVQQGIERIRRGLGSPGVVALLEVANRDPQRLVAADFGFVVGPRINAAGRLAGMGLGIECLLSEQVEQARMLASQLDQLNRVDPSRSETVGEWPCALSAALA